MIEMKYEKNGERIFHSHQVYRYIDYNNRTPHLIKIVLTHYKLNIPLKM